MVQIGITQRILAGKWRDGQDQMIRCGRLGNRRGIGGIRDMVVT